MRTSQEKLRQKSRGNSSKESAAGGGFQQQEEVSSSRSVLEVLAGGGFVAGISWQEKAVSKQQLERKKEEVSYKKESQE